MGNVMECGGTFQGFTVTLEMWVSHIALYFTYPLEYQSVVKINILMHTQIYTFLLTIFNSIADPGIKGPVPITECKHI